MENIIFELYEVIKDRKENRDENSYTGYLFNKGIDKILKKLGEECTETIISAKNDSKEEQILEIGDLIYHLLVTMAELNISVEEVEEELKKRRKKINNLKGERRQIEEI
ncbi:phosphoribosyl-ATP pyrophosphatase HisE [Clostridium sartagoforme AAU1]|uniref:Phosphoribosyl-ATP pyrophosphatase n=1 Tax=Clostridium sartagoforme AAU1 TaxID=1202534 RepID=R9CK55_9CLOT|nr:phosphoribosyl-ATP diphosphatase [Clostridium sartagoforme]EOR27561.1 phosphoribosyl-ATP pyrophosphatase HisE [Clostridium sartagoforme AAU1]